MFGHVQAYTLLLRSGKPGSAALAYHEDAGAGWLSRLAAHLVESIGAGAGATRWRRHARVRNRRVAISARAPAVQPQRRASPSTTANFGMRRDLHRMQ